MLSKLALQLLALVLLVAIAWVQLALWVNDSGFRQQAKLKRQIVLQQARLDALMQENKLLENDILDLRHGVNVIEEQARWRLNMIKPGETLFLLP
jgi:cell division protein FtsB